MPATLGQRRVLIAVEPRLLADTLAKAVQTPDVDVVIDLTPPANEDRFDVAVVMTGLPPGAEADVVVCVAAPRLDDSSVTQTTGTQPAAVGDLTTLLETLHRFLGTV
jgi:hypothetical protein